MVSYLYDFNGSNTSYGSLPAPVGYPQWQLVTGDWRRYGNRAYTNDSSFAIAVVELGGGDCDCTLNISSGGGDCLYFRVVDEDNWWRVRYYRYTSSSSYTTYDYEWAQDYSYNHSPWDSGGGEMDDWHREYDWSSSNSNPPSFPYSIYHGHYGQDPDEWYSDADAWLDHTHYRDGGPYLTGNVDSETHYSSSTHRRVYVERCVNGNIDSEAIQSVGYINELRVRAQGSNIQVWVEGRSTPISINSTVHQTASRHGIGRGSYSSYGHALDNFYIDPLNQAPNAPTVFVPGTMDVDVTNRINWSFADPDGDTQASATVYYRVAGTSTWTTVTIGNPNTYWDAPPGTFTSGSTYELQVTVTDVNGATSPASASQFFLAGVAPDTPNLVAPAAGATVDQTAQAVWEAAEQDGYRIRTVADDGLGNPDTSVVYTDTGEVLSPGTRAHTVRFDQNNRTEHVQLAVLFDNLWSDWASVLVNVSYTPPRAPIPLFYPDHDAGALLIQIINPAPSGSIPQVVENEIWLDDGKGKGEELHAVIAKDGSYLYRTPVHGWDYEDGRTRVVAIGSNSARTETVAGSGEAT